MKKSVLLAKTAKLRLCATVRGLIGVTFALHLYLVGKSMIEFLQVDRKFLASYYS